ncbi:hypothetical protein WICMUC_000695 [Wickerhamomyces mucosus]|uniref:Glutamyl-tRNA(Gln) amidotransferase subunit A, mitochondrial n=1 Tax=Wickerhamomyces mucosus TaxID=1378264 RepID=A0A9P8PWU2_9ASCO|nr:hypothetical protein WICMUC_000695 [Wickerhamomyces mucosus]
MSTSATTSKTARLLEKITSAQAKYNIFTSIRKTDQLRDVGTTTAAIKDNICTIEEPTTSASGILKNYISPFEATVVTKMKQFGTTIVGKTNLDEFGMGSANTNSIFGTTYNPLFPNEKRIPGGSSGGSAAAVAAGVVDYAIGTDTGGSVRVPGAFCGVYGLKPSYGRISRWGVLAYAQSLDTVGVLAKDLDLLEKVYYKLDGYDIKDPTSLSPEYRKQITKLQETHKDKENLRIGIPEEFILDLLSDKVKSGLIQSLIKLLEAGHEIVPISIPNIRYAIYVYFTIASSEASSNLARYDGIRYGVRSSEDINNYAKTRTEGFGKIVQDRLILGNYNLSSDSFEKNFLKAIQVRNELRVQFNKVFKFPNVFNSSREVGDIDFILSPTTTSTAPLAEDFENQTIPEGYAMDILAAPASLAGLPALSVPWYVDDDIPIGLQIVSQYGNDAQLFTAARLLRSLNI